MSDAQDCAEGIAVEIYSRGCAFYCGAGSEGRTCPCTSWTACRLGPTTDVREHVLQAARTAPPACQCGACLTARNKIMNRMIKK